MTEREAWARAFFCSLAWTAPAVERRGWISEEQCRDCAVGLVQCAEAVADLAVDSLRRHGCLSGAK